MQLDRKSNGSIIKQLELWPHQIQALQSSIKYIDEYNSGVTKGSALVHMPTGSGKTRIIGTLAQFIEGIGCVLILAPRIALRDQLFSKLHEKYFKKKNNNNLDLPKNIRKLTSKLSKEHREFVDRTIFISTIQFWESASKRHLEVYDWLSNKITLLMIDEGHYEPALSWSRVIRQIKKPKILFTATPFRNDFKSFDIDINHRFTYPYRKALENYYLRNIIVEPFPPHEGDPHKFITDVIDYYLKRFPKVNVVKLKEDDPRIIIRCDSKESIEQIVGVLAQRKISYIGIHEKFDGKKDINLVKHVPNPQNYSPLVWIHQFKLIEGIDDNRFRLLAAFEPLTNTRSFVQQVGRIMRNPNWKSLIQEDSYVIDHTSGQQKREFWEMFLAFDEELSKEGKLLSLGEKFFAKYSEIHPEPAYIDKKFRRKFNPINQNLVEPIKEFKAPLKTNLMEVTADFEIERLYENMQTRLLEMDKQIKPMTTVFGDSPAYVIIYFSYNNSPYLTSKYFLECKSDIMIFQQLENYLAFYDSSGYLPINEDAFAVGKALQPQKLKKLLRSHSQSSIVQITLNNSHTGERAIRQSAYTVSSLEKTAPNLSDHSQIITQVVGYSFEEDFILNHKTKVRRYIGFRHGHISEAQEVKSLNDYLKWLEHIKKIISGNYSPLRTFTRYAQTAEEPRDPTPKNILLDFFDVQDQYYTVKNKNVKADEVLYIEDECQDIEMVEDKDNKIKPFGRFHINANGLNCAIEIRYDYQKKKYELNSSDLNKLYKKNKITDEYLIGYLNKNQSFRIIPNTENYIYVGGGFYKPIIKYGNDFNIDDFYVGKILHKVDKLKSINDEKGKKCLADHSGWDPNSLFGIVSSLGKGTEMENEFGNPDILICDDKHSEVADFILANTKENQVAFIHAKANSKPAHYSAGALGKVCEQAIKNIHYISMFNQQYPKNIKLWSDKWSDSKVKGYVKSRIIRPTSFTGDPQILWSRIREIIRNPGAKREVWILLGNTLYYEKFVEHLSKSPTTPAAIQAATLLHGALTNISSMDVKLKIFCSP